MEFIIIYLIEDQSAYLYPNAIVIQIRNTDTDTTVPSDTENNMYCFRALKQPKSRNLLP